MQYVYVLSQKDLNTWNEKQLSPRTMHRNLSDNEYKKIKRLQTIIFHKFVDMVSALWLLCLNENNHMQGRQIYKTL